MYIYIYYIYIFLTGSVFFGREKEKIAREKFGKFGRENLETGFKLTSKSATRPQIWHSR